MLFRSDGDIYYYDIFFLTWTPKHEKEDLLTAHGSFLFLVCQNTMEDSLMDPCIILLLEYGNKFIFTFIDLHILTITMQCIAPQEGKIFTFLHDQRWAKLYDGGSHILCGLGKKISHYMYV